MDSRLLGASVDDLLDDRFHNLRRKVSGNYGRSGSADERLRDRAIIAGLLPRDAL